MQLQKCALPWTQNQYVSPQSAGFGQKTSCWLLQLKFLTSGIQFEELGISKIWLINLYNKLLIT